jgi:peroxin-2
MAALDGGGIMHPQPPWESEFFEAGASTADAVANAVANAAATTPRPPWALRVLRSVQLDAERLDAELRAMLHEQLVRALGQGSLFPAARVAALEPEAGALVGLLVWLGTVRQGRATPGSALMNLRYRDERPFAPPFSPSSSSSSSPLSSAVLESAAAATAATRAAGAPPPPSWVFGDGEGVEGAGLTRAQRLLFGVGYVLVPYLWARAGRAAALGGGVGGGGSDGSRFFAAASVRPPAGAQRPRQDNDHPTTTITTTTLTSTLLRRLGQAAPSLETAWRMAALLNLLAFLRRGVYRSLLERLVGARLVTERPCAPRSVSFEYLNRQLVWQELSEFVLFVLPLLDARQARLRAAARRWLPQQAGGGARGVGGGEGTAVIGAAPWTVAPALPGEEAEEEEEAAKQRQAERAKRKQQRGVRRREGGGGPDGGGGGGGGLGGRWLAQQVSAAASAMAGVVAAGAARAMGAEDEPEGPQQQQQQQQQPDGGAAAAAHGPESAAAEAAAATTTNSSSTTKPPGPCPLCGVDEIVTPYVALPCRHVFCYYCLRANTEGDARFACPCDGRRVAALRRWAPAEVVVLLNRTRGAVGEQAPVGEAAKEG